MVRRRAFAALLVALSYAAFCATATAGEAAVDKPGPLDPKGRLHIPIGIPDTVDTLKTFVEPEGNFSPGVGSYGVYFWLYDRAGHTLTAPTMESVKVQHGLAAGGLLIPWSQWKADDVTVRSEVCEVRRKVDAGADAYVVGARVRLTNTDSDPHDVSLYVALRPLGPAGWRVYAMSVSEAGDALLVDGHPAVVATRKPERAAVTYSDMVGVMARHGVVPDQKKATCIAGFCSGALCFDLTLAPGEAKTVGLVCPVLPGRRAVGHKWDNKSPWRSSTKTTPTRPRAANSSRTRGSTITARSSRTTSSPRPRRTGSPSPGGRRSRRRTRGGTAASRPSPPTRPWP